MTASFKQRDLISENTAHLLFAAVQLLCEYQCDPSGLLSGEGGDAESMLKARKSSRHVSYVCTCPNYPTNGLALLGLHFILTAMMIDD